MSTSASSSPSGPSPSPSGPSPSPSGPSPSPSGPSPSPSGPSPSPSGPSPSPSGPSPSSSPSSSPSASSSVSPSASPPPDVPDPDVYYPPETDSGTGLLNTYSKFKDITFNLSLQDNYGDLIDDSVQLAQNFNDSVYYNASLYTTGATTGNMSPFLIAENFINNQYNLNLSFTQDQNSFYFGSSGAQRYYKILLDIYTEGLKSSALLSVFHYPAIITGITVNDFYTPVVIGTGENETGNLSGQVNFDITFTGGIGTNYIVKSLDIYTGANSGTPSSLNGFSLLKNVSVFEDSQTQNFIILNTEVPNNTGLFYKFRAYDDFGAGITFANSVSGYLGYVEPPLFFGVAIPPALNEYQRTTGYFSGLDSPVRTTGRDGAIIFQDDDNLGQNFYILKSGQWQTLAIYEEISGRLPYPASSGQAFSGNANDVYLSPSGLRDAFSAWGEAPLFASRAWANFDGGRTTLAGTFSRVNYTVTVDIANHGLSVGDIARLDGTLIGWNTTGYIVDSVTNVNQFTFTHSSNGTANGSVNLYKNPIRAAGNVSSIASIANGDHLVNFINPMPDENYAASVYAFTVDASPESLFLARSGFAPNADYFKFRITNNTPAGVNVPYVMLNIIR